MDTNPGRGAAPDVSACRTMMPDERASVLVIGGGAAGITVAAELRRHRPDLPVTIIEPSDTHSYQPGWTLVGAGVFTLSETVRPMETLLPGGVTWIKEAVSTLLPDENLVELTDGRRVRYRHLVICPGLKLDWDRVAGLREALGSNGVCSNYSAETAEYTWQCLQEFVGGKALFTQPAMPIKCAGAPQKIMYLAADHWRKRGLEQPADVEFCLAGDTLFGVPFFVPPLQQAVDDYGITLRYKHNLKAVHGASRTAFFTVADEEGRMSEVERRFDLMHVTPPQIAPDFVRSSPLANAAGWIEVDPSTLQHTGYANVFSLGDVAGTTNAKTAAAVRLQAPVVVRNLLSTIDGKPLDATYDGYGSCPLTTAYGKVVLAEFTYGGKVTPTFPLDPRKPRRSAWFLKTKILPFMYWKMMLRGSEFDVAHREREFAQDYQT
ncbi:NAD(P)/FAD-dependent oxidoreductase [Muricoccus vinaceus]|uniref:FAD/NAD(P)-binding oxidoreductase n=1 Tax=Muricoccus vinaceus TaxID=424704 RepID=A0ABV6IYG4_9PROT